MSAHPDAVGAAALEFGASLPQNPADLTGAVWIAAFHKAIETYEAKRGEPLVEAYMRHVMMCEDWSFLQSSTADNMLPPHQLAALRAIESRIQNEN